MNTEKKVNAVVSPAGSLVLLSQREVSKLRDVSDSGLHDLFRRCSLAVMNSGNDIDDAVSLMDKFHDFDIRVLQQDRGVKLEVINAPADAFVDGEMIRGIREHLFAVLRDLIFTSNEIENNANFDLSTSSGITNAVFHIARNAKLLKPGTSLDTVVCWGGHSINRTEYEYTKEVGYELGLRGLNICTGCGPGAMKGPMKGAAVGHAKQRVQDGRYIGISEPGIIAAESPNAIVNELAILPDIEKRLEAFVRVGHGIIVFPGGVGTAEEILYLLGILLHPDNKPIPFPFIFSGPKSSEIYFQQIDNFVASTLGPEAQKFYKIIVDDPARVAYEMSDGIEKVAEFRKQHSDAFYYNWRLTIEKEFQMPFKPTHENMAKLQLHRKQEPYLLASNLRKAFSGMVAGNVKEAGIREIQENGPFKISGDLDIMEKLDHLLREFVKHNRMRLPGVEYTPCYELVS